MNEDLENLCLAVAVEKFAWRAPIEHLQVYVWALKADSEKEIKEAIDGLTTRCYMPADAPAPHQLQKMATLTKTEPKTLIIGHSGYNFLQQKENSRFPSVIRDLAMKPEAIGRMKSLLKTRPGSAKTFDELFDLWKQQQKH